MQLEILIGKLLLHNNCVVVPSFGGFVASRVSARIDQQKGSMQPPHKAVLFNKQLINNDGLLVHAFAQENNISFDEAVIAIEAQVKNWHQELTEGKRIQFEQLGFLFLDNEKNLCFEQDRFHNLLLSSFGLGAVRFITEQVIESKKESLEFNPISKEELRETPIISLNADRAQIPFVSKRDNQQKNAVPIRNISTKRVVKYIAAACLLPLGFYSFWIPMKTDVLESGLISTQDLNPFHRSEKGQYISGQKLQVNPKKTEERSLEQQLAQLPESVNTFSFDLFENGSYYQIKLKNNSEGLITTSKDDEFIPSNPNKESIQVLAGSFSNEANAKVLQRELLALGFSAFTYPESNGLTRVSAGKFSSLNEAQDAVERLSAAGKSSWVLK